MGIRYIPYIMGNAGCIESTVGLRVSTLGLRVYRWSASAFYGLHLNTC